MPTSAPRAGASRRDARRRARAPSSIRTSHHRVRRPVEHRLDRLMRSGASRSAPARRSILPIFDAGRLRANFAQGLDLDLAIENYNGAIVDAARRRDQLGSWQSLERQRGTDLAQTAAESPTNWRRSAIATARPLPHRAQCEANVLTARRLSADLLARATTRGSPDPRAAVLCRAATPALLAERTRWRNPETAPRRRSVPRRRP